MASASLAGVDGEDALRLEAQGLLEKYGAGVKLGSKWQQRFVRCQRDILEIHHYKGAPPAPGSVPSRVVDLREMERLVAKPDFLTLELFQRRDGARAVQLRAASVGELEMWAAVIRKKLDYLEQAGAEEEEGAAALQLRFATNTFTMLALMDGETEIEELAETTVEEAFQEEEGGEQEELPDVSGSSSPAAADASGAPSWAAGGGNSPLRSRSSGDADEGDGAADGAGGGGSRMTMERAAVGVGKVVRVLAGLVSDLETELRAAAAEGEGGTKKVALVDRLFAQYYAHIEDRLVLEVATATPLGQQDAASQERLAGHSASGLMAALACWRRVRRFEARLQGVAARPPVEGLRSAARLADGCALAAVLVPEPTLISCVVSLALREAEDAWNEEVDAVARYYQDSSSSQLAAGLAEEPSPRRFTISGRRRPLSSKPAAVSGQEDRRPVSSSSSAGPAPPSPRFSAAIDALERLLASMEPFSGMDEEEDEAAGDAGDGRQQATFLRNKAFTSAVLFLSGQIRTTIPLEVRNEADEGLVLAVIEDLGRCQERVAAVQARFFGGGSSTGTNSSSGGGGEDDHDGAAAAAGDMGEVAGVFAQAAERFASDRAAALLLDHALGQDPQLQKLVGMLFVHPSWRHGEVTPLLIGRFRHVLETRAWLERLPATTLPLLPERVEARLLRTFLVLYLRQLLRRPVQTRSSSSSSLFEAEDAMAFLMDETAVQEWVEFRGRWASRPQRLEDLWVLKRIRIWLLMPPGEALEQFAEAWLQAHPSLGAHLYDLLRFCMLLRRDVDAVGARGALAAVRAFLVQMGAAATGSASPAPVPSHAKILTELFPRAGTQQQHVTGEAWRWEEAGSKAEQEALAVAVGPLVLTACEKLRRRPPQQQQGANGASPERMPVLHPPPVDARVGEDVEEKEKIKKVGEAEEDEEEPAGAVVPVEVAAPLPPASPAASELPAPIVPVVAVSPRAAAAAAAQPQPPASPSAASTASSANPFEDEDEDDGGEKQQQPQSPRPQPPRPQSPSTGEGKGRRMFGGGWSEEEEEATIATAPPPPPPPQPKAASPRPPQEGTRRRIFGGGMFTRSGASSSSSSPRSPTAAASGSRHSPVAATAAAAMATTANPFEDEEEGAGGLAAPAPAPTPPQPQRRVFGGGMAAAGAPTPAVPVREEAAAPRRFAGGAFGGGGGGGETGPAQRRPMAQAPAAVPAAPPARRSPLLAEQQPPPQQPPPRAQQPQGGGRRSFGGGW